MNEIESKPIDRTARVEVEVRQTYVGRWSRTGYAWNAYLLDGTNLYCGAETREDLITKLVECEPRAVVVKG
jgi:hypothetical protein